MATRTWIWIERECGHHRRLEVPLANPCPYCVDHEETREAIMLDLRRPKGAVDEHVEAVSVDLRTWPDDAA